MQLFEEIKARVSMRDLLEHYNIYPTRGTNIYKCPFHDDRRPSASIIRACDKFNCFACGWHGDIFDVVQHFEKCDHKTAMKIIDEKFGLELVGKLSREQKLQIVRNIQERENKKRQEKAKNIELKAILEHILSDIRFWVFVQKKTQPTLDEFLNEQPNIRMPAWIGNMSHWFSRAHLFFYAIEQQKRLDWLYSAILGRDAEICEYTFIYGKTKEEVLQNYKKEIMDYEKNFAIELKEYEEIIKNDGDIAERNDRKELINYIIKSLLQNNNQT